MEKGAGPPARPSDALSLPAPRTNARDALLQAAGSLIVERSTLDVSIADVAARANISRALVRYHVGDRDGLLAALMQRDAAAAVAEIRAVLADTADVRADAARYLGAILRIYLRQPYCAALARWFAHAAPDAFAESWRRQVDPVIGVLRELVKQGATGGTLRDLPPAHVYLGMLGACDQLFLNAALIAPLARDAEAASAPLTEHLVATFLAGLRTG